MFKKSRKWQKFKSNRRAYISLWIFAILFIATCAAEFIANDKPFIISYKEKLYFPYFNEYSETEFGGFFETEAVYTDQAVIDLIEQDGWMLWPPVRYDYSTINYNALKEPPSPPTGENILGTDDAGRDVFARAIYGFRISVLFGFILTAISAVIGIIIGASQGYVGGLFDLIFERIQEIWGSIPTLFLIIIMTSFITPNFWWLLAVLLLFGWMGFVGAVRAECFKTRNLDYVKAARALGVSERKIMLRHVLPNSLVATITVMPFALAGSVTILTQLDFLGFGLPVGSPSLGELLAQGKANLDAPWLGITGFCVIALVLSLLVFIGEGMRDALDPRKI